MDRRVGKGALLRAVPAIFLTSGAVGTALRHPCGEAGALARALAHPASP